jgi:hypothetical protein
MDSGSVQGTVDLDPKTTLTIRETSGVQSMSRYVALIQKSGTGYSAHVPDIPGCIAPPRVIVRR